MTLHNHPKKSLNPQSLNHNYLKSNRNLMKMSLILIKSR